jgi:phage baseplate assembly protein W
MGSGSYGGGADPSVDGSRYPWYGYKPSGLARVYVQPDYQPATPSGKTRVYTLLEDCTITAVGGFSSGASLGTVTVTHKRGATTITTRTASGGSFASTNSYVKNDLSGTIIGLAGDTIDVTSSGTPQSSDSDANTVLFGVTADRPNLWPLKADGRSVMYGTATPTNPPPATPAGLAVTAFTWAHCALGWGAVSDADLVGYNLWRRVTGVGSYVKLNTTPIVGTAYDDTTVAAGTSYQYEISAVDALPQESALSAPITQAIPAAPDTTRPASPAMPTLTIGDSQITVDQIPLNTEPDMDHYTLEYKASSSSTWIGLGTVAWPKLVLSLTNGTPYDFRSYAVDFSGNVSLLPSAVATGTPVAAPVVPPPVITPEAPQLPPLADDPHFGFPFYVASHSPPRVNVVEQDSPEHVMSCLDVIARCPIGFRIERPDFGIPWLEYRSSLDPAESLENALLEFEPRAQMHIDVVREWAAEAQARMTANVEVDGG